MQVSRPAKFGVKCKRGEECAFKHYEENKNEIKQITQIEIDLLKKELKKIKDMIENLERTIKKL